MKTVMVLGAGGNAGRSTTKCLQKAGYLVVGADIDKYRLELSSADEKVLLSRERKDERIIQAIERYRVEFVHAQPDSEVEWLAHAPYEIRKLSLPLNEKSLRCFSNKFLCQSIWRQYMDLSFLYCSLKQARQDPKEFVNLQRHNKQVWIRARKGAGSRAALPVCSLDQALSWADFWNDRAGLGEDDFYLQEFLPGREFAVQMVFAKGVLIGRQGRERLRPFWAGVMPSGQSSTPEVASINNDAPVLDVALKAVTQFDKEPHGIYGVDMKESHRGQLIPTEVNYGRFYTTVDFFEAAGVNFPAQVARLFIDKTFDYEIDRIKTPYHWIRGLDSEPKLVSL